MKEINDNEIRIIGHKPPKDHKKIITIAAVAVIVAIIAYILIRVIATKPVNESKDKRKTEQTSQKTAVTTSDSTMRPYTEISDTTINDVKLCIYTPCNAVAELQLDKLDTSNPEIVLAAQAAFVYLNNNDEEVLDDFVLKGEQLSYGKSKNGYCSIIGNEIKLGRCDNNTCCEEAVEGKGYFFRQYSLVSDSLPVKVTDKRKAVRNALCWYKGNICVIGTQERESFHDFSQALADLGVSEAVNLIGGNKTVFAMDKDGKKTDTKLEGKVEKTNYIVWKAADSRSK